ncbi:Rap1a/Tai family immunity protein [Neorhizobium galegae]|uniref:Rap1a/Tai family immunity protein n=1 Tax=Neorhizobium galegae TaxID=399 RepID=UPI00349EAF56
MRKIVTLVAVLIAGSARAEFYDGNGLHELCRSENPAVIGYVAGWVGKHEWDKGVAFTAVHNHRKQVDLSFYERQINDNVCVPVGAKVGQASDIFCKYLLNHPEDRHFKGQTLVAAALREAWPCQR